MVIEPVKQTAAYQGSASGAWNKVAETSANVKPQIEPQAAKDTVTVSTGPENANAQKEKPDAAKQNEQIKKAVESINKSNPQTEAIFGIHEGTNRVTIKIVDKESKEVIKEFPPEETLDMIAKIWEMAGLMVDEKR